MDGFSILDPLAWDPEAMKLHPAYTAGNAAAWLSKSGAAVGVNHYLSGRLYVSKSGWLLLSVPNALVRGVFDAMNAPGAELPHAGKMNVPNTKPELLNAHISVMTAEEVQQVGADKINERGHHFHYALGPVKEITPKNVDGISKVWAIQVASPELAALRKTYGLSALPNDDHPFHITVAVRRKNVLRDNDTAKYDIAGHETSRGELKAASAETKWQNFQEVGSRPHGKDMTYRLYRDPETAMFAHMLTDKKNARVAEIVLRALPNAAPGGAGTLFGVHGFHTYPEYRRKGYGRALWDEVSGVHPNSFFLAQPDNYKDSELNNDELAQVYSRLGFEQRHHMLPALARGVYVRGGKQVPTKPKTTWWGGKAAAEQLPWRERAEVYARDPSTGKLYGGKWDNDGSFALPGGGIDPGEDPATAALRELEEETGIKATNARVLPVAPVDSPWSDKVRAEKAKIGRGNFAGSRTHFVAADIVNHPQGKNLDFWAAKDRGYYDPAEALAIMKSVKKFNVPTIANARMAAINHLIAEAAKKQAAAVKDILPGGEADHVSDSEFPPKALAEGKKHEREHTGNDEIAKEIAKDHLSEDPAYYEKVEAIEKDANSVYLNQAKHMVNPLRTSGPIPYDHNKPVFENIRDQLYEAKRRGDFMLQADRNQRIWRASLDPKYRYNLAIEAFRGQTPQPHVLDQIFERYGDGMLNSIPFGKK